MIILDTNIISEWMKSELAQPVARWLQLTPQDEIYTTAISEAEIRYGTATDPKRRRKQEHEALIERLFSVRLVGRILPFDSAAAKAFSAILVRMRLRGRALSRSDAQIAAIASVHNAAIATRDAGFDHSGVPIIDPWNS